MKQYCHTSHDHNRNDQHVEKYCSPDRKTFLHNRSCTKSRDREQSPSLKQFCQPPPDNVSYASWDNSGNRNLPPDRRRYHGSYKESHSPDRRRNHDRSCSKSRGQEQSPSLKLYSHSSSQYESSSSYQHVTKGKQSSPHPSRLCDSHLNDVFQVKKHSTGRSNHDSLNSMGNYESQDKYQNLSSNRNTAYDSLHTNDKYDSWD